MKAVALALAAFSGLPGASPYPTTPAVSPPAVVWPDTWILLDPRPEGTGLGLGGNLHPTFPDELLAPETSASDEVSQDLLDEGTDLPRWSHPDFVGCELALAGSLTPESWARELWVGAPPPLIVDNGHNEKDGRWLEYEQIPRRPGRPEAYVAYRYPLADAPVVSGYDLDKPDDEQRRGKMNAVGHGGVDLVAEMGAPITMLRLEHQRGDAEVLYVGPLYGETVVTRHVIREAGRDHDYVLIFGHLDRAADGVLRGRRLREGATVGYVGNTASPQLVHLHLEARRMRDHVDAWRLPGDALHAREYSVVVDPRNVLPLRDAPRRSPKCAPRFASPTRHYWLGEDLTLTIQ